jgi:hypothetical protein
VSVEETAKRLGVSLNFILTCAAAWGAATRGVPFVIVPASDDETKH